MWAVWHRGHLKPPLRTWPDGLAGSGWLRQPKAHAWWPLPWNQCSPDECSCPQGRRWGPVLTDSRLPLAVTNEKPRSISRTSPGQLQLRTGRWRPGKTPLTTRPSGAGSSLPPTSSLRLKPARKSLASWMQSVSRSVGGSPSQEMIAGSMYGSAQKRGRWNWRNWSTLVKLQRYGWRADALI